mmetsp:Transcript_4683/g.13114  ORF Transcript_4683/g.13114 Transcript_4683/m.13114 type:complete len:256 (-) Transcript_4683:893-1660(-)
MLLLLRHPNPIGPDRPPNHHRRSWLASCGDSWHRHWKPGVATKRSTGPTIVQRVRAVAVARPIVDDGPLRLPRMRMMVLRSRDSQHRGEVLPQDDGDDDDVGDTSWQAMRDPSYLHHPSLVAVARLTMMPNWTTIAFEVASTRPRPVVVAVVVAATTTLLPDVPTANVRLPWHFLPIVAIEAAAVLVPTSVHLRVTCLVARVVGVLVVAVVTNEPRLDWTWQSQRSWQPFRLLLEPIVERMLATDPSVLVAWQQQ